MGLIYDLDSRLKRVRARYNNEFEVLSSLDNLPQNVVKTIAFAGPGGPRFALVDYKPFDSPVACTVFYQHTAGDLLISSGLSQILEINQQVRNGSLETSSLKGEGFVVKKGTSDRRTDFPYGFYPTDYVALFPAEIKIIELKSAYGAAQKEIFSGEGIIFCDKYPSDSEREDFRMAQLKPKYRASIKTVVDKINALADMVTGLSK